MICTRGIEEKWQKVHFNRVKSYRGDPEVRHSVRHKNRTPPIYEEKSNEIETEQENEDRPFHVFKPTTAESQAASNKPRVTFSQLPEIVEQDSDSENENASRDESNERQILPHLTTIGRILGDDSENSKSKQFTVRNDETERLLDEDRYSLNESQ